MGLDFIRSTRTAHTKAWSAAYQEATSDMFGAACGALKRVPLATIAPGATPVEGESVIVRLLGSAVVAYRGLSEVARVDAPPSDLVEALTTCYGMLRGTIVEVNTRANLASVLIEGNTAHD